MGGRACSDLGAAPQVLVGSGVPGLRAPCPVAVATEIAPEAVAHLSSWSSLPATCSPVQVRGCPGDLQFSSPPISTLSIPRAAALSLGLVQPP